jgi:formylglycine-generating enzyme required for sulfatase activity
MFFPEVEKKKGETKYQVTISRAFWMQKTELTQAQWSAVTGEAPWAGMWRMQESGSLPAACISWDDVTEKLLPKLGAGWSLPTEAEWEYACRAGTLTRFYWGDSERNIAEYANTERGGDDFSRFAPVGRLFPNQFGLHDMIGNVWEWCRDWYSNYFAGCNTDPAGPSWGYQRVIRGGSWLNDEPWRARVSHRRAMGADRRWGLLGARLVLPVSE